MTRSKFTELNTGDQEYKPNLEDFVKFCNTRPKEAIPKFHRQVLLALEELRSQQQDENSNTNYVEMMAQVFKELYEGDYDKAMVLSVKLMLVDNNNPQHRYLYASSLYHCLDYKNSYEVIKSHKSVLGLYLFAKNCLKLANCERDLHERLRLWTEGSHALFVVLSLNEFPKKIDWAGLAKFDVKHRMPTYASSTNLLGDFAAKVGTIEEIVACYRPCAHVKFSAFLKLRDTAPETVDVNRMKASSSK